MIRFLKQILFFFINVFDFKFDFPLPPRNIKRLFQISFWTTLLHLYHIRKVREKKISTNYWEEYNVKKTPYQEWLRKIFLVQYGTVRNKKAYDAMIHDNDLERILDIGCGSGASSACFLLELVHSRYPNGILNANFKKFEFYGIDISQSRIDEANEKIPILLNKFRDKIKTFFNKGDITKINFNNEYFDYVIIASVIDYLDDKSFNLAIKEVCRVAKKGIHIIDFADKYPMNKPRSHFEFSEEMSKFGFILNSYEYRITKSFPKNIRNQLVLDMFFVRDYD